MRHAHQLNDSRDQWQGLQAELEALMAEGDLAEAERRLLVSVQQEADAMFAQAMQNTLDSKEFRDRLRPVAEAEALRCRGSHEIAVRMPFGTMATLRSPYFVPAKRHGRKQRKPGPGRQRGTHLALAVLGVIEVCCPGLAMRALQLALLCPSYAVAESVLQDQGIDLGREKLRALVTRFAGLTPEQRVELSTGPTDSLAGRRVLLAVDGGRCRERRNKPGRIPAGAKGRGYHTDWREPKLFTIAVLDDQGQLDRSFPAQVDGAIGGKDAFLDLLAAYLTSMDLDQTAEVQLVGDGAPWIWKDVPALLRRLGLPEQRLTETLDWTHAKQNLLALAEDLDFTFDPETRQAELCDLLHSGQIETLCERLGQQAAPGRKRRVRKKARDYFLANAPRMQYENCRERHLARGSGIVESAIRRVVNLRVKAAGSFWLRDHAEAVIFLRSKLLYGRWERLKENLNQDLRHQFQAARTEPQAKVA